MNSFCQILGHRLALLVSVVLVCTAKHSFVFASDPISLRAFSELSIDQKRAYLRDVFQERLDHSRNISYRSTTRVHLHDLENGALGDDHPESRSRYDFEHRRSEDSYWLKTTNYKQIQLPREYSVADPMIYVLKPKDDQEIHVHDGETQTTFKKTSFGTSTVRVRDGFGSPLAKNHYCSWLSGDTNPRYYVHHFQNLVQAIDKSRIEFDRSLVRVTIEWDTDDATYSWWFLLDPKKGFIPREAVGNVRYRRGSWRVERFDVFASQRVADVWMPTDIRKIVGTSSLRRSRGDVALVYRVTASEIVHGCVSKDDLLE